MAKKKGLVRRVIDFFSPTDNTQKLIKIKEPIFNFNLEVKEYKQNKIIEKITISKKDDFKLEYKDIINIHTVIDEIIPDINDKTDNNFQLKATITFSYMFVNVEIRSHGQTVDKSCLYMSKNLEDKISDISLVLGHVKEMLLKFYDDNTKKVTL